MNYYYFTISIFIIVLSLEELYLDTTTTEIDRNSNHIWILGVSDTHQKVFLLTVNICCADGVVGSVFLSNGLLALRGRNVT